LSGFSHNIGAASAGENVTPGTIRTLWGSALGYAMDGFDLLILGFMLRAISADLDLDQSQAAFLVTATLLGAVVGGLIFGMLSRPVRAGASVDLDDCPVRNIYWPMRLGTRLLGPAGLPDNRGTWLRDPLWLAGSRSFTDSRLRSRCWQCFTSSMWLRYGCLSRNGGG
jgi:MFS family permease